MRYAVCRRYLGHIYMQCTCTAVVQSGRNELSYNFKRQTHFEFLNISFQFILCHFKNNFIRTFTVNEPEYMEKDKDFIYHSHYKSLFYICLCIYIIYIFVFLSCYLNNCIYSKETFSYFFELCKEIYKCIFQMISNENKKKKLNTYIFFILIFTFMYNCFYIVNIK